MKRLIINGNQEYLAEKIIKDGNNIKLINVMEEIEGVIQNVGDLTFPNISDLDSFKLEEGQVFDILEKDEKILYDLDIDFRLSKMEMGL